LFKRLDLRVKIAEKNHPIKSHILQFIQSDIGTQAKDATEAMNLKVHPKEITIEFNSFDPTHTEDVLQMFRNICGWPEIQRCMRDKWNFCQFIRERPELFKGLMPYDEETATRESYDRVTAIMNEFQGFEGYNSLLNYELYYHLMQDGLSVAFSAFERYPVKALKFIRCNPDWLERSRSLVTIEPHTLSFFKCNYSLTERHSLLQYISSLALDFLRRDISPDKIDDLWFTFCKENFGPSSLAITTLCPSNASFQDFLKDYLQHFYDLKNPNLDRFGKDCKELENYIHHMLISPTYEKAPTQTILTFEKLQSIGKGVNILLQGLKIVCDPKANLFRNQSFLAKYLIQHLHCLIKNPEFIPTALASKDYQ
jgi:hypothetical protein